MFIPRLPIYDRNWIAAPIGAVAGALGAAFSTNGPPMVIYGMLRNLGPAAFRGTLNAFFTANNIAVIGGLATSGILTVSIFKLVLFCIPTMILGSLVGQYVHKRISVKVFRVMVFFVADCLRFYVDKRRAGNSRRCRTSSSVYLVSYTATGIW